MGGASLYYNDGYKDLVDYYRYNQVAPQRGLSHYDDAYYGRDSGAQETRVRYSNRKRQNTAENGPWSSREVRRYEERGHRGKGNEKREYEARGYEESRCTESRYKESRYRMRIHRDREDSRRDYKETIWDERLLRQRRFTGWGYMETAFR